MREMGPLASTLYLSVRLEKQSVKVGLLSKAGNLRMQDKYQNLHPCVETLDNKHSTVLMGIAIPTVGIPYTQSCVLLRIESFSLTCFHSFLKAKPK